MTGAEHQQAVFAALADPTRRAVLRSIASGEASTATELAERLPVTRQAVRKHLALLEQAQLVDAERVGRETRWATVEEVRPGEHLSFWWHAYDALATLVEVSLVAVSEGTRIVVVESGYAGHPVCGSPWAGGASSGPRARSAAAATASPSFAIGHAYVLTTLDWEPALERLRRSGDLVTA